MKPRLRHPRLSGTQPTAPVRIGLALLGALWTAVGLPGCQQDRSTSVADSTAPAPVGDLSAEILETGTVRFSWTASGDNGLEGRAEAWEIRGTLSPPEGTVWESAPLITGGRAGAPGTLQQDERAGLTAGAWHFTLTTIDDAGNRSPISNVSSLVVAGAARPLQVSDLRIVVTTDQVIKLQWTAPGTSDGSPATRYDIRFQAGSDIDPSWESAPSVADPPAPGEPGTEESLRIPGLAPLTPYTFALRASVRIPSWSEFSNSVHATTSRRIERVTTSTAIPGASEPDWGANGRIAYVSSDASGELAARIRETRLTGGSRRSLTNGEVRASAPAWSPNERELAYVHEERVLTGEGHESYFQLALLPSSADAEPTILTSLRRSGVRSVSWSPDGSQLVYATSTSYPPPEVRELYTVARTGGAPTLIVDRGLEPESPAWSPDGSEVLFASASGDLWIVAADGGLPRRLTETPSIERTPAWSPDGTRVTYASNEAGSFDIWIMDVDGGNREQITRAPSNEDSPSWSPGGSAIAFRREGATRPGPISDIWVAYLE